MKIDSPINGNSRNLTNEISRKNPPRPQKKIPLVPAIVAMAIILAVGFAIGTRFGTTNLVGESGALNYAKLDEIYSALQENYTGKLDKTKMIDGAAAGMVSALGDQYTEFFTADEAKEFDSDLNGTLIGVGIQLGQDAQGQLEVIAPIDDSPAKKAGILAGDLIAKIDGKNSLKMSADEAVNKIRGKAGTKITLTILRGGKTKDYELVRENITVPSTTWKISTDGGKTWTANDDANFAKNLAADGDKIGYIRISQFSEDTASLSQKAAGDFAKNGVKKIVLDLRGNGGGYVDAAQSLVSLWLPYGAEITKEIGKNDKVLDDVSANGSQVLGGAKTVVLIDGGSASASEIAAAALRENNAATLIGQKSYGKGVMQQLVNLSGGAELKVTIAKWMTPNGKNINGDGIEPDEKVDLTAEQLTAGNDTQLNAAVEKLAE